jgi:hypothetical protein
MWHCGKSGLCLAEGGAVKCPDNVVYCATGLFSGCVPAKYLPDLCTRLYTDRKTLRTKLEDSRELARGLRAELATADAERQAAVAARGQAQSALAKAEQALAEATGLCDGCQMTVPECVICVGAPAVVAHVPCGHRVYCLGCNPGQPHLRGGAVECELCRTLSSAVVRVY